MGALEILFIIIITIIIIIICAFVYRCSRVWLCDLARVGISDIFMKLIVSRN